MHVLCFEYFFLVFWLIDLKRGLYTSNFCISRDRLSISSIILSKMVIDFPQLFLYIVFIILKDTIYSWREAAYEKTISRNGSSGIPEEISDRRRL